MQAVITAARFALIVMVLGGLLYPLVLTILGQLFFPYQANGSLIRGKEGVILGSALIGQVFTHPEHFHPRPSATGYDAANTGGSNLAATSGKLIGRVAAAVQAYREINRWTHAIAMDAVTASASGIDPHISVANAMAQAKRVAEARKLPPDAIRAMINRLTERTLAETPYVNVLKLNLALEGLPFYRASGND